MTDAWHEGDRQIALAEFRIARLHLTLTLAHVDLLGLLLKEGQIAPWGARASLAELCGPAKGDPNAQDE
jgi:hypothetical protein